MLRKLLTVVVGITLATAAVRAYAADATTASEAAFRLTPQLEQGIAADVEIAFEVGGDLIETDEQGAETRTPMSVVAEMAYEEQLVAWWADASIASRSLRRYSRAEATIKKGDKGATAELPADQRLIAAKSAANSTALNGLERRLNREEYDLIDLPGNSLVIDRLLPRKELKVSEGWDHDAETIAALLDMDHVAICEVRSEVIGMENRQVQIRLTGNVHGTVEGAATEIDLRGAYLFHLDEGRITKMNLAIKELRKPGEVTPGLDVVAKLSLTATPLKKSAPRPFDENLIEQARKLSPEELGELQVETPSRGYRFRHDSTWYVTGEQREHMALKRLERGDFIAHCNISTMTARPADKPMTLQEFEADVVKALGDKLENVEAATEWANEAGHQCLGVIARGTVEDLPMEWRYYRVAAEGKRAATISVTLEQSLVDRFSDADKAIVESMVLLEEPAATAAKPLPVTK